MLSTSQLIDALIERVTGLYVFPDRAEAAAALIRAKLDAGEYADVGPLLCEQLSADLLEATNDKHLRLLWHADVDSSRDEAELTTAMFERFRRENHGVRRVELLEQNIGLIALTLLPPAVLAAEKMTAAMTLVQDTDALIIDLRENRGGSPDGVTFFASYFFKDGETRLSDVIEGPSGEPRQFWTLDYVPGKRYLDRPVYALTSAATFSGGEAFAYDLKALGRATVIGEQTRGGAHPSSMVSLAEHVELRLPTARSVNPHTDANWEGVGVEPDVPVPASEALDAAIAAARTGARRGLA